MSCSNATYRFEVAHPAADHWSNNPRLKSLVTRGFKLSIVSKHGRTNTNTNTQVKSFNINKLNKIFDSLFKDGLIKLIEGCVIPNKEDLENKRILQVAPFMER
ncbi:hypothetical protein EUGRSUZ_J02364 [Eucalyptus grandis]|uniref:Uncharacterized protein n=2 Tax=Eucalyptus grandis TaxID=71139 RepID=A0ACC3J9C0_EUCGR|nr:hypothetical protein EUGRSUZ_J02364 [Eucalyptus grandis]